MLLAAVLLMVEPRFTRRVVEAAGEGVTEKVQTIVRESTGELTHRLDDLESLFEARIEEEATAQGAAIAAMSLPPGGGTWRISSLYKAEGRLPTKGGSARERALGIWLHRRRQEAAQGVLSPNPQGSPRCYPRMAPPVHQEGR